MSHDYLREIDLNPNINGAPAPITSPLDPRALHYFGFLADGQEVSMVPPFTGAPTKVDVSFHYGNQPTVAPPQPTPPIDAILDPFAGPLPTVRYEVNHERRHVLVWLDAPTAGVQGPCMVRVRAWARE